MHPSHRSPLRAAVGLFLFLACGSVIVRAQSGATIRGLVKAAGTGDPVVGAVVRLTPKRAGLRVIGKTDKNGRFRLMDVAPGVYRVTVECVGYRATELPSVEVSGRDTVSLDIPLSPQ